MAIVKIAGAIYVEDTTLSSSTQTKLTTTLGGTTFIDKVDEVPITGIKNINTAPLTDIGVIDEITKRTQGSKIFFYHTEDHSTHSGYETLKEDAVDAARTTYSASGLDTDTYPLNVLAEEFCTEETFTEKILSESWTWQLRSRTTTGASSATHAGLFVCYVYRRVFDEDLGYVNVEIGTGSLPMNNATENTRTVSFTVTGEFVADQLASLLYFYMYEIDILV